MKELKDKIWETRKARINMESRLILYGRISEIVVPIYSVFLIALAIFPKQIDQRLLNFASILGSIIILIVSIILSSYRFDLRAKMVKDQYIFLNGLYARLINGEDQLKISSEYDKIMSETENHSEYDYLKLKVQLRRKTDSTVDKPSRFDVSIYYLVGLLQLFLAVIVFVLPITFILYLFII